MISALRWMISLGAAASIMAATLMATTALVLARTAEQWKCTGNADIPWNEQIAGCTRVINSALLGGKGIAAAHYNRGNAYQAAGDYDRAIADYNEAIRLDPKNPTAYTNRGNTYNRKRDYDRAIADYNEAIRLDPRHALAYNGRGSAYHDNGDYDRAIADYNEAIRLDPKNPTAYTNRGNTYNRKRDYDRAIADYNEAIRLDPRHALAYNGRGDVYNERTDYDRAIADYSEAIRLDPKYALAYDGRGSAYQAKGDHDRAIANYNEAIRLDPKNPTAYNDRGNASYRKGDYDGAIADYNEAIRLDPKYASAYNGRGNAYRANGDYTHAIADYNEAIRLDPKYASAYNGRGSAYRAKGDYDHAIADYTEAIRLDPKNTIAYFNRGRANLYIGALPKALADLNQATALDPKYAYTALWVHIVDKRSNLPSRLAQATSQLDMTAWPAPLIRLYLGEVTPEAVLAAADDTKPETKSGQVCEANFYIGELALQRGGKDEAAGLFRLAAAGCPKDFIEFDAAKAELKALGAGQPSPAAAPSKSGAFCPDSTTARSGFVLVEPDGARERIEPSADDIVTSSHITPDGASAVTPKAYKGFFMLGAKYDFDYKDVPLFVVGYHKVFHEAHEWGNVEVDLRVEGAEPLRIGDCTYDTFVIRKELRKPDGTTYVRSTEHYSPALRQVVKREGAVLVSGNTWYPLTISYVKLEPLN